MKKPANAGWYKNSHSVMGKALFGPYHAYNLIRMIVI
jgi:hypothetical protein